MSTKPPDNQPGHKLPAETQSGFRLEIRVFFTALMFLTRLPVPKYTDHQPEYLQKSPRYFPWVGLIVGGLCALAFAVCRQLFPVDLALVVSMLTGIMVTGAFHEDGFADVCDGFGGGWTKEKILLIMKDSRLGTFGVVGLIGILGLKFLLLQLLPEAHWAALLLLAHAGSRFCAMGVMQFFPYATDVEASKSRDATGERLGKKGWIIATAALLVPFFVLPKVFSLSLIPAALGAYVLARYFKRWIGGYTGDCLGAIQQVTEILFYASFYIIWQHT